MKLLAFAASNSKKSINKQLVTYAASLVDGAEVEVLDLNDYELPLFSVDREAELGHPELAKAFLSRIAASDALMISFAEHNGSYSAAWKNLFDWSSRIGPKVFQDKPMVLLSTSPGARGGASVLAAATGSAPFFGGRCESQSCDSELSREFRCRARHAQERGIEDQIDRGSKPVAGVGTCLTRRSLSEIGGINHEQHRYSRKTSIRAASSASSRVSPRRTARA